VLGVPPVAFMGVVSFEFTSETPNPRDLSAAELD
jgi:hypothetical protein